MTPARSRSVAIRRAGSANPPRAPRSRAPIRMPRSRPPLVPARSGPQSLQTAPVPALSGTSFAPTALPAKPRAIRNAPAAAALPERGLAAGFRRLTQASAKPAGPPLAGTSRRLFPDALPSPPDPSREMQPTRHRADAPPESEDRSIRARARAMETKRTLANLPREDARPSKHHEGNPGASVPPTACRHRWWPRPRRRWCESPRGRERSPLSTRSAPNRLPSRNALLVE